MPRGVKREESMQDALYMRVKEESMQDADYLPDASVPSIPDTGSGNGVGGLSALPPNVDNIIIKNHFPVARIKRIMQADDDVGKVAQVTPVVVSKALELFMISLVTKAAAEAKSRNSKRVGAVHLKQAITKNEQFDFLNEIVSKVPDAPEKSEDAMDVDGKKKKAPSRKKKKADSDDDF
ncbi:histone-fold-containing protein [Clathrospora elynae]|uniref:NCT transcriptional regulatory complex subunit A n=1 Tax=Clathrospora elynae TaxID=706981 RepID=A0A6A5T154_9PLEO|nr:histone-fold-containing protein [Clathrospora elynae]